MLIHPARKIHINTQRGVTVGLPSDLRDLPQIYHLYWIGKRVFSFSYLSQMTLSHEWLITVSKLWKKALPQTNIVANENCMLIWSIMRKILACGSNMMDVQIILRDSFYPWSNLVTIISLIILKKNGVYHWCVTHLRIEGFLWRIYFWRRSSHCFFWYRQTHIINRT